MAKEYSKQHIVPQFYLNNFATNDRRHKIAVRRVSHTNKVDFQIQSTREVGFIKNYYSVESEEDYAFYEKLISKSIEYPMNKLIKEILTNSVMLQEGENVLNERIIWELAKYISFQSLRVPAFYGEQLKKSSSIIKKTKQQMLKSLYYYPDDIKRVVELINFNKDDYKRILLDTITNDEVLSYLADYLVKSHEWFAYINKRAMVFPFVTSDNPVVISNFVSGKVGIENGIARSDTSILFPVSQKVMIQALPKAFFVHKGKDNKNTIVLGEEETKFIVRANLLQERQRYKETYYPVWFYRQTISEV